MSGFLTGQCRHIIQPYLPIRVVPQERTLVDAKEGAETVERGELGITEKDFYCVGAGIRFHGLLQMLGLREGWLGGSGD